MVSLRSRARFLALFLHQIVAIVSAFRKMSTQADQCQSQDQQFKGSRVNHGPDRTARTRLRALLLSVITWPFVKLTLYALASLLSSDDQ
jgi:hypothetical protein